MAKEFASRISKKNRTTLDMSQKLNRDLLSMSREEIMKGATLTEIKLCNIVVKEQVRTKFNDSSLKKLADNIQQNGLIQPLIIHKHEGRYTLICGERRYRALTLLGMEKAKCSILEDKTPEELLAIQFSENSSREDLHYIDLADGIYEYHLKTGASERKIQAALSVSKSEVHRSLMIAKLPEAVKAAAKKFNIEKYVLVEYDALPAGSFKKKIESEIIEGIIRKRSELKKAIKNNGEVLATSSSKKSTRMPVGLTANALLKVMNERAKELDPEAREQFLKLIKETHEIVDFNS